MTRPENAVLEALIAIRDSDLAINSKIIAFTLLTYMTRGNAVRFPSINELATQVRLTPRATRNALGDLVAEGMLPAARMQDFRDLHFDDMAGEGGAT